MSGNGQEWTRTLTSGNQTVPFENPGPLDLVHLRAGGYKAPEPFCFVDLENKPTSRLADCKYLKTLPDLGFRVVIEP